MKLKYNIQQQQVLDKTFAVYTGSDGQSHIIELNGVAPDIIDWIGQGLDEDGIVKKLMSEYAATEEQIRQDVKAFVSQLIEAGLIES